jgi:NAD(P)-dependent dehydrogenase (short-subunit alcohol dehydrogenase family)
MPEKTAMITGAATGIGRALALRLDREGWTVFAGVNRSAPDELVASASEGLRVVKVDVTNAGAIDGLRAEIEREVGARGLDLLVNNAASTDAHGPLEFVDLERFRFLMDVNFWAPLQLTRALLPLLREGAPGRIVNVTSASVHLTIPLGAPYPVSKCAARSLSEHLRLELAPFGVEVCALEPGGVATAMTAFDDAEERACWDAIPEPMRAEYRRHFEHPSAAIAGNFEMQPPDDFAALVYRRIVCARKLAPVYLIGKGVAPLPWLHRLLPLRGVEAIMRRLFRVKA